MKYSRDIFKKNKSEVILEKLKKSYFSHLWNEYNLEPQLIVYSYDKKQYQFGNIKFAL